MIVTPSSPGPFMLDPVRAFVLGLLCFSASCAEPVVDRQFDDFESWVVFDRGVAAVPPNHPSGGSTVYLSAYPEPGALAFPVGTRIIRITNVGDDPATWEAHAMVKVGGDFNAFGAAGWEFYGLTFTRGPSGALVPHVQWHGEGPTMNSGYADADGGVIFGCNTCHATATYNDSVLGDELFLDTF